ncbi:MAG: thiamine pyrophosphate-dependent enzyme [Chloroflexota bacterium]
MEMKKRLEKLGWLVTESRKLKKTYNLIEGKEDLLPPGTSACLGCGAEVALRFTVRVLGQNTILGIPASCTAVMGVKGFGNEAGARLITVGTLLSNPAGILCGIKRHFQLIHKEVQVVAWAGDAATADVGFQSLSGAAERGENIIYICYDNESQTSTGGQRSATSPWMAETTTTPAGKASRGKPELRKNLPLLMAMHGIPYVATANMAYPADYLRKLQRAMEIRDGLVYLHLYSPCPVSWEFPPDQLMRVNKLAVETSFFPLWEADHGKFRITKRVLFPRPAKDYLSAMGRFAHLSEEDVKQVQQAVKKSYRQMEALCRL